MELVYEGKVAWIFSDHFDVDLMIGMQNVRETDIAKLSKICMRSFEEDFPSKVAPGDILVGGKNFAYGHAHPQSMAAVRMLGIHVILAESFAPGFFRGESGNGMALLQVPGISGAVERFDRLRVDYETAAVCNLTKKTTLQGVRPSRMSLDLVRFNGYQGFLQNELDKMNRARR